MKNSRMQTERLTLSPMDTDDAAFIFELLNSPSWIRFIGDKNIHTMADAAAYIVRIQENPAAHYWVVRLKEQTTPLGVVTFMKRDYLEYYDMGYAFLERYGKMGYALEASGKLLEQVQQHYHTIMATVLPDNHRSINLLQKLGFRFEQKMTVNNEHLLVYKIKSQEKSK